VTQKECIDGRWVLGKESLGAIKRLWVSTIDRREADKREEARALRVDRSEEQRRVRPSWDRQACNQEQEPALAISPQASVPACLRLTAAIFSPPAAARLWSAHASKLPAPPSPPLASPVPKSILAVFTQGLTARLQGPRRGPP
jgi:hypothetical protein